jgi:prepilin signal peptidase PulO-like enzyme (type II secretory pathway)
MSSFETSVIELALVFATSIFFAAIAIDRETILSSAIASVTWLVCGMFVFLFDPLGSGQYICWIFFIVGTVFVFQLLYKFVLWYQNHANERFEVAPL